MPGVQLKKGCVMEKQNVIRLMLQMQNNGTNGMRVERAKKKKNDPKDKENNYFSLEMKANASSRVGAYAVASMHKILFVRSFVQ